MGLRVDGRADLGPICRPFASRRAQSGAPLAGPSARNWLIHMQGAEWKERLRRRRARCSARGPIDSRASRRAKFPLHSSLGAPPGDRRARAAKCHLGPQVVPARSRAIWLRYLRAATMNHLAPASPRWRRRRRRRRRWGAREQSAPANRLSRRPISRLPAGVARAPTRPAGAPVRTSPATSAATPEPEGGAPFSGRARRRRSR